MKELRRGAVNWTGNAYAQRRAARQYTEADVERLVDEARAELRAGHRKRR